MRINQSNVQYDCIYVYAAHILFFTPTELIVRKLDILYQFCILNLILGALVQKGANSTDSDQILHNVASNHGQHCLWTYAKIKKMSCRKIEMHKSRPQRLEATANHIQLHGIHTFHPIRI